MSTEQTIVEVLGREIARLRDQIDSAKGTLRAIRDLHEPVRVPCIHHHRPDEGGIWKVGTGECAAGSSTCHVCGGDGPCLTYTTAESSLRYLDVLDQDGQAPDDGHPWEVSP